MVYATSHPDVKGSLHDLDIHDVCFTASPQDYVLDLPESPFFLHDGKIHQAYLLSPDTIGAFVVATILAAEP